MESCVREGFTEEVTPWLGFRAEILGSQEAKNLGLEVEKQKGHFWADGTTHGYTWKSGQFLKMKALKC